MKQKLSLVFISAVLFALLAVFFNTTVLTPSPNVIIAARIIEICNRSFLNYELTKAPAGVQLAKRALSVNGLALPVFMPVNLLKENPKLNLVAEVRTNAANTIPIAPDVPILPEKEQSKACPQIQQYADNFFRLKTAVISAHSSAVFQLNTAGNGLGFSLKTGYQAVITTSSLQAITQTQTLKNSIATQYQDQKSAKSLTYDFLIIYQNGYQNEINDMVSFYSQHGIRAHATLINDLPGYDATGPVPSDCSGEFLKECYHFWGDPATGISQLAIPSLPGYVAQTAAFEPYTKVSFVPGLIRAWVRLMKRTNPIRGILLVGNARTIPPYYSPTNAYYYDGIPELPGSKYVPSMKLFTDLYYAIPNVPVISNDTVLAHQVMTPHMFSCTGPSGVRLGYWCNSDEWRYWSTPPLGAIRNPAHVPQGKIYSLKYDFMNAYWATVGLDAVVPVGRLVTQDRFYKGKDPVVARYVEKLKRWYKELPNMKGNAINSNAGSTNDHWIYTKDDIDQFQSTFGTAAKIYASEFFLPDYQCAGRCVYKTGQEIMTQMGTQNIAAFHLNGHGGHIAIQAPYGNGNTPSSYLSENSTAFNDGLRLEHYQYPAVSTIRQVELQRKLIGVIFANSCSPSDYLLANQMHYLIKANFSNANQRSWAEQWIAMEDAGALSTFVNGGTGWGYSDNNYNVAYMKRLKTAWSSCGTIGDAQRMMILDGLRNGGSGLIGEWQLYNRHFLGSTLNPIARLPRHCLTLVQDTRLVEENISEN